MVHVVRVEECHGIAEARRDLVACERILDRRGGGHCIRPGVVNPDRLLSPGDRYVRPWVLPRHCPDPFPWTGAHNAELHRRIEPEDLGTGCGVR